MLFKFVFKMSFLFKIYAKRVFFAPQNAWNLVFLHL